MLEQDQPGRQERLTLSLIRALDLLRDGIRPFVVAVLEEKEGSQWFEHPRVQRMVSTPRSSNGEAPYGGEGPTLDLALLLKLIGSDCYWYRTFSPRLANISRWQIDSLRELRNRVAHHDGTDPLLTSAPLLLPYLSTMEQLLRSVDSQYADDINKLRKALQRRRRQYLLDLILGRSRWSVAFWLGIISGLGAGFWLITYSNSLKLQRPTLVIGTPDQRLERYLPLEQYLEISLRPAQLSRALLGGAINVRVERARSYQEAIAHLREHRWDVVMGFSPVVSMEAINSGYRPIGHMFPTKPEYMSILFTSQKSNLQSIEDITPTTRLALGDFFSATKYYIPMSLLRGRRARVTMNLSTEEIAEQVRSGNADVGAMAGNPRHFEQINPGLKVLTSSDQLPPSIVGLSPTLTDLDRNQLQQALLNAPVGVRGESAANFAAGSRPDYGLFSRKIAEGRAFSACLDTSKPELRLHCPLSHQIDLVEGWIDDIQPENNKIRIQILTADQRTFDLLVEKELLQQSAIFKVLSDLRGRLARVLALQGSWQSQPLTIQTPHQLEIK